MTTILYIIALFMIGLVLKKCLDGKVDLKSRNALLIYRCVQIIYLAFAIFATIWLGKILWYFGQPVTKNLLSFFISLMNATFTDAIPKIDAEDIKKAIDTVLIYFMRRQLLAVILLIWLVVILFPSMKRRFHPEEIDSHDSENKDTSSTIADIRSKKIFNMLKHLPGIILILFISVVIWRVTPKIIGKSIPDFLQRYPDIRRSIQTIGNEIYQTEKEEDYYMQFYTYDTIATRSTAVLARAFRYVAQGYVDSSDTIIEIDFPSYEEFKANMIRYDTTWLDRWVENALEIDWED